MDRHQALRATAAIALAIAVTGLSACGESTGGTSSTKDTVTVGLLSATSGPLAAIGEEQNNGFAFYLDQHDGALGGHPVRLEYGDEGTEPRTAISSTRRLITQKSANVLVGVTSTSTGLAVKDFTTKAKVPMLITSAGDDSLTAGGPRYIYRTHAPNAQQCRLAASAMLDSGKGGAYLTSLDAATGRSCTDAVRGVLKAHGIRVVGTSQAPLGTTDFQPYLAKIKKSHASVVFAFYAGSDGIAFTKQYTQFGLQEKTKLVASANMVEEPYLTSTGNASVGVQSVTYFAPLLKNAANARFAEAYEKKFGHYPNYAAVASYDAAAVLDKALARVKNVDQESLAKALAGVGTINSPRGSFTFNKNHDPAQRFYIREAKRVGGRLVNVVVKDLGRDG